MKLLICTSRVPYPLDKGDKLRAYYQIKALSEQHEIYLCCISDEDSSPTAYKELKKYCKEVHIFQQSKRSIFWNLIRGIFRGLPLHVAYFYNKKHKTRIEEIARYVKPDSIYCQLIRMAPYVTQLPGKKTIDYMDAFSTGIKRRISKVSFWLKPIFYFESKRLARYEKKAFKEFDQHTIISEADRDKLAFAEKENIHVLPNGVNLEYFHPPIETPLKSHELVFVGNMSYAPNILAAEFLAKEIMPLLWQHKPEATLLLAGINPDSKVKILQSDRILVSGFIPDIREAYLQANIFIAPMHIGTGLQNKLLEAMALGIPAITSKLAYEGIKAPLDAICIAETPEQYVWQILDLLNNKEKADLQASKALNFVQQKYHWSEICSSLNQLLQG